MKSRRRGAFGVGKWGREDASEPDPSRNRNGRPLLVGLASVVPCDRSRRLGSHRNTTGVTICK